MSVWMWLSFTLCSLTLRFFYGLFCLSAIGLFRLFDIRLFRLSAIRLCFLLVIKPRILSIFFLLSAFFFFSLYI